ncbi:MAG: hypothetical protein ACI4TV_00340 [Paludibacteraceae bacterium]
MKKPILLILITAATLLLHANTPYITRVYEYTPAPGQFINTLPMYEEGDTEADMLAKVSEQLVGRTDGLICLGAWGGYVTFGFDHPVVNVQGEYDLLVYGNCIINQAEQPDGYTLGSPEPGVVYVSCDENKDGIPNDTWYELAGSETENAVRDYEVTYQNTGRAPIPWTDNKGNSGFVLRNQFHTQASYYPMWRGDESYILKGTRLPDNVYSDNNNYMFDYGYVDNWPNTDERAKLNLDNAIDAEGKKVALTHVDFIRVQTGTMTSGSLTGEASTEVAGAEDLHPNAPLLADVQLPTEEQLRAKKVYLNGALYIEQNGQLFTITGQVINK